MKKTGATYRLHFLKSLGLQEVIHLSVLLQILRTFSLAFLVNLFITVPAWALQSHGAPEGLYVHQMAHVLYMCALAYLYWDIRRTSFSGRGWRFLQLFCVLIFLWNIIALTGHAVGLTLEKSDFYTDEGYWHSLLLGPITAVKLIYYLAKMDHLVCVPALFFLFLSLRIFYHESKEESKQGEAE